MTRCIEAYSVRDEILYGEAYVQAELEFYIKKVFDDAPPPMQPRWCIGGEKAQAWEIIIAHFAVKK